MTLWAVPGAGLPTVRASTRPRARAIGGDARGVMQKRRASRKRMAVPGRSPRRFFIKGPENLMVIVVVHAS